MSFPEKPPTLVVGSIVTSVVMAGMIASASAAYAKTPILYEVEDIEAVCRVMYAEARNQSIFGKIAVVEVIVNRLRSGEFAGSVSAVIEQKNAFEPVTKAGGKWRNLPALSDDEYAECKQIIALKNGDDVSGGATYFQNADIVRQRAKQGKVRNALVNFGGMPVTAEIDDHTFYSPAGSSDGRITRISAGEGSAKRQPSREQEAPKRKTLGSPFVSEDVSGMYTTVEADEVLPVLPSDYSAQAPR